MREMLSEIFGSKVEKYENLEVSLPLYLKDNRRFIAVSIYGHEFVIVQICEMERFSLTALKKQLKNYEKAFAKDVVYSFGLVTSFQRKALIENGISFITGNGQVFLPFLGMYFKQCSKDVEQIDVEKMTPAAQALFLLLLYGPDGMKLSKNQAAVKIGLTAMSITRAAAQLQELGLVRQEKKKTSVLLSREPSRPEYYKRGKEFLTNPVQDTLTICKDQLPTTVCAAGEYELTRRTELGYPKIEEYAIYKNSDAVKGRKSIPYIEDEREDIARIQLFKYELKAFSVNGRMDPVSLISTFKDTEDERILQSLDSVEEEIKEWEIEI